MTTLTWEKTERTYKADHAQGEFVILREGRRFQATYTSPEGEVKTVGGEGTLKSCKEHAARHARYLTACETVEKIERSVEDAWLDAAYEEERGMGCFSGVVVPITATQAKHLERVGRSLDSFGEGVTLQVMTLPV